MNIWTYLNFLDVALSIIIWLKEKDVIFSLISLLTDGQDDLSQKYLFITRTNNFGLWNSKKKWTKKNVNI